jgi:hypothetical protein
VQSENVSGVPAMEPPLGKLDSTDLHKVAFLVGTRETAGPITGHDRKRIFVVSNHGG